MSIEVEITVTIATVDVDDDCQVQLDTRRKRTVLTPDEAVQLANELMDAASKASEWAEPVDRPVRVEVFDLAPLCRDCGEGKHGACIGSAFVESGPDVDEVACRCAEANHPERAS
jgi:hypothetical protein